MAGGGTYVNIAELLSVSLRAARAAGVVLRHVAAASQDLKTVNKAADTGGWDPQTVADRQAQHVIIKALTDAYPGIPIVGEEDSATPLPESAPLLPDAATTPSDAGIVQSLADACPEALKKVPIGDIAVFVDPLDATRAFVAGHYQYVTTLIGIAVLGAPVAGIIARPFVPAPQFAPHGAYSWGTGWVFPRLQPPISAAISSAASEGGSVCSATSAGGSSSASKAVATHGAAASPVHSWSLSMQEDHMDVLYGIVGAGVVGAIDAADPRLPANQRSAHAGAVPTGSVTPASSVASMAGDSTTDHAAAPDLAHSVLGPHHKRVTPAFPVHFPTRVTTSFTRSGRDTEELLVSLGTPPSHRVSSRGAGCKGVEVLRGAAGLYMYPRPMTSRWDTAAVEALLLAMGGALYNTDGKSGKPNTSSGPPAANRAAHKYNYVWTPLDKREGRVVENKHGVFASQYPALARCALRNQVGMPSVHELLRKQGWGPNGMLTPAELDTAVQHAVDASRAGAGANTGSREGRPHVCSYEVLPPIANDDFTPPPPHTPSSTAGGSVSSTGSASPYLGAAHPGTCEGSVRLRLHWGMLAGGRDPPVDAAPLPKSLRVSLAGWGKCPVANAHHVMMLPSEVTLAPPDKPLGGQKRPRV